MRRKRLHLVLLQLGNHDDGGAVKLPDHPPEVGQSCGRRALGRYVLVGLLVALETDRERERERERESQTRGRGGELTSM